MQLAPELPITVFKESGKLRMLKIHRSADGEEVIFTLSGRMDDESTGELENLIRAETKGQRIVLDVRDLTLVGQRDVDFLARCETAGIKLVKCAHYVRDWIARQRERKVKATVDHDDA